MISKWNRVSILWAWSQHFLYGFLSLHLLMILRFYGDCLCGNKKYRRSKSFNDIWKTAFDFNLLLSLYRFCVLFSYPCCYNWENKKGWSGNKHDIHRKSALYKRIYRNTMIRIHILAYFPLSGLNGFVMRLTLHVTEIIG